MVIHCPHCGAETDRPQLFSISRQRIFNYIWDNPTCTREEVERGIYGAVLGSKSNVVAVHISNIRKQLETSKYRLITRSTGRRISTYKIVMLAPTVGEIRKANPDVSV
jgi:hypothetical protein